MKITKRDFVSIPELNDFFLETKAKIINIESIKLLDTDRYFYRVWFEVDKL